MHSMQVQDMWTWLRDIMEPLPKDNASQRTNHSEDVLCANCISSPDQLACARAAIVAFLGVLTAGVAVVRVFSLHSTRRLSPLKLLLYYIVVLHCGAGSLEWIFGWTTPVSLGISYLKAIELLIVCYFYLNVATRMMAWNTGAGRSLLLLGLLLLFSYFSIFAVLGFVLRIEPWTDCHAPYWVWFSLGQLATVQLMVSSFLCIIHRINRLSAAPSMRGAQKAQIMVLLYVYEASALADVAWHVVLFMLADDHKGCSGIFNHDQLRYSLFKLPYDICSFIAPVWAILYVFRPTTRGVPPPADDEESEDNSSSSSGSMSSDVIIVRNWRRRYRPLNTVRNESGYSSRSEDRNFVDPSRQVRRNRKDGAPGVRRVSSAPSMVPPTRRHSVSRSLISSPLYPIPEEPFATHSYTNRLRDDGEGPSGVSFGASSIDNASTEGMVDGE